jgi:hypothetical protein
LAAAAATVLVGALAPTSASAITPLPPGILTYQIDFSDPTGSGTDGQSQTYPVGGTFSVGGVATPQGTVAASGSVDTPFQISASSTAVSQASPQDSTASATTGILFFLTIPGSTPTVPLGVQALLQSTGEDAPEGDAFSYASLTISDTLSSGPFDFYFFDTCSTKFVGCNFPVTDNVNTTVDVLPNTLYLVFEQVFTKAVAQSDLSSVSVTASATADPHFFIPPQYLADHPDASLQISPGLEPLLGAVPEPRSWALMMLGVGLAGAAVRRRRTAAG